MCPLDALSVSPSPSPLPPLPPSQEHHAAEASTSSASSAEDGSGGEEELFDLSQDKHKGQYALRKLYHASDRLIAVLYTSPTCGPCRSLKPILNGVMDEYKGRIHFVEIDIEADPEIAEAAGVTGTPTVQLFKDKARITSVPGVKQKREYRELITSNLGSSMVAV